MSRYLLDANVFIQAKRFHYPFDIFPGYWEWLDREMEDGSVFSIVPIYDELTAGEKQGFKQIAQEEYFTVGDSWLIAKAGSEKMTIVTHEKFDARCKKRVLIPNVCREYNIECINTVELIRRTGAKF